MVIMIVNFVQLIFWNILEMVFNVSELVRQCVQYLNIVIFFDTQINWSVQNSMHIQFFAFSLKSKADSNVMKFF